jgi:hypothetical protein
MKEIELLPTKTLLEEAKASGHGEAYRTLDKNQSFRIGVGVRLNPPKAPSFFVEILIRLCPSSSTMDLEALEKGLTSLKALQARNYLLICQGDNCITCETTTPPQNQAEEYAEVKSLIKAIFS